MVNVLLFTVESQATAQNSGPKESEVEPLSVQSQGSGGIPKPTVAKPSVSSGRATVREQQVNKDQGYQPEVPDVSNTVTVDERQDSENGGDSEEQGREGEEETEENREEVEGDGEEGAEDDDQEAEDVKSLTEQELEGGYTDRHIPKNYILLF